MTNEICIAQRVQGNEDKIKNNLKIRFSVRFMINFKSLALYLDLLDIVFPLLLLFTILHNQNGSVENLKTNTTLV